MHWRERILKRIAAAIYHQYPTIIVIAVLMTIVSLGVSGLFLKTKTGRIDLISESNPASKRFLQFLEDFGSPDDLVLLVQGGDSSDRKEAVDDLAQKLKENISLVESVFYQIPIDFFKDYGLQYLDLTALEKIDSYLKDPQKNKDKLFENSFQTSALSKTEGYLSSKSEQIYFMFVKPTQKTNDFKFIKGFLEEIQSQIDLIEKDYPSIQIQTTGVPPIIYEEMVTTTQDVKKASVLSFLGIALLFMLAFQAFRKPLMVVTVMFMGIAYTFCFATFAVGSLNLMSIVFASMLLGSGNDFGVHILMRYREERLSGHSCKVAIETVVAQTGQGIISGAIATALVFYTLMFSNFKGFAEFGLISGTGVLICCAAMLIVIPAFLVLWEKSGRGTAYYDKKILKARHQLTLPHVAKLLHYPKSVIAGCLILTGFFFYTGSQVQFNGSLLDIQAKGSKSFANEKLMMQDSPLSPRFAAVLAKDFSELKQKSEALKNLPIVSHVESAQDFLPKMTEEKKKRLGSIQKKVDKIDLEIKKRNLNRGRLSSSQKELVEGLTRLSQMKIVDPLQVEDLPKELKNRYVGKNGEYLIYAFPKKSVWSDESLTRFTEQVARVDEFATGTPFLVQEVTRLMKNGYKRSGWIAFLVVTCLLLIDFRRIVPTLLALTPLVMGVIWMFGLMGVLGVQFNPANLIAVPLILGIAIDNGVHLVHRFYEKKAHRLDQIMKSTIKAVYLNSITTIVCFGSLILASHRGISSLGLVLVLGVLTCLITSITFLPAVLSLFRDRIKR